MTHMVFVANSAKEKIQESLCCERDIGIWFFHVIPRFQSTSQRGIRRLTQKAPIAEIATVFPTLEPRGTISIPEEEQGSTITIVLSVIMTIQCMLMEISAISAFPREPREAIT